MSTSEVAGIGDGETILFLVEVGDDAEIASFCIASLTMSVTAEVYPEEDLVGDAKGLSGRLCSKLRILVNFLIKLQETHERQNMIKKKGKIPITNSQSLRPSSIFAYLSGKSPSSVRELFLSLPFLLLVIDSLQMLGATIGWIGRLSPIT